MKIQKLQAIKQHQEDYSIDLVNHLRDHYCLTDEELENSKLLNLSERDFFHTITRIGGFVSREVLSSRSEVIAEIARKDRENIDQSESRAIRLANQLELFDQKTVLTLYQESLRENFDPKIKSSIIELQIALKEDGKYNDTLDGKPGPNTMKALSDLILENTPALIKQSHQLQLDNITNPVQKLVQEGFDR